MRSVSRDLSQAAAVVLCSLCLALAWHLRTGVLGSLRDPLRLPSQTPSLTLAQLLEMKRSSDTLVLDMRPEPDYRAGHIPGAGSLPPDKLQGNYAKAFPPNLRLILYCSGRRCGFAEKAAHLLKLQISNPIYIFPGGFEEWRAAEQTVESP